MPLIWWSQASAKDVLRQASKTNKLLKKHGPWILHNIYFSHFSPEALPQNSYRYFLDTYFESGVYDAKISEMASYARSEKNLANASRNLNNLIHRKGKTLPVPITAVQCPIRVSRRRRVMERPWPVLHLSDWLKVGFGHRHYGGSYFLGGYNKTQIGEVETMLAGFWGKHASIDCEQPPNPRRTIPFFIHGDEGRGQCRRPLLVISFQVVLGWDHGGDHINSTKSFGYS